MIHIDTSFLIRALDRDSPEDQQLRVWLREGVSLGISAVSWAEFLCGPVDVHDVELAARVVDEPVALLAPDAGMAAELFNLAGRRILAGGIPSHVHLQETLCEAILDLCLSRSEVVEARVSTEKSDVYPDCRVGYEAVRRKTV